MFVAIVTAPFAPASAIIIASRAWFLAFKTSWRIPLRVRRADKCSDFSTETVPTKTGCPLS